MPSPAYAARTRVSPERTRADIERELTRYGARQFMFGRDDDRGLAVIEFVAHRRRVRLVLHVPDPGDRAFTHTPARRVRRTAEAATEVYNQAVWQRWRALLLVIKAKLEAVAAGIVTFEDEFLPYTVLPDGRTVAETVHPAIASAYASGQVPELLPALGDG